MKKINLFYFLCIASLGVFLTSCGAIKNSSDPGDFHYPLQVGNQWTYSELVTTGLGESVSGSVTVNVLEAIETADIPSSFSEFFLEEIYTINGTSNIISVGLYNNEDGLYAQTHTDDIPSGLFSKTTVKNTNGTTKVRFNQRLFDSVPALCSFLEHFERSSNSTLRLQDVQTVPTFNSTVKMLGYPLTMHKEWECAPHVLKRVIGKETLVLSSGTFKTYKIQVLYDTNQDNEWDADIVGYEYVSSVGLVKKELHFYGITNIFEIDGELVHEGEFDMTVERELTSYRLN